MKHALNVLAIAGTAVLLITSCKKDVHDSPEAAVSDATLNQIQAAGFSTDNVQKLDGGYLVEGDIFLTDAELSGKPTSPNMIIAEEEQYRTFNLVNPNSYPTIKVALNNSSSAHEAVFSAALDAAISRYNALGLTIKFSRVTSSPNTTVVAFYEVSNVLGSSGFPTSGGAPYNQVRMNTYHYSTSTSSTNINYIATIMAHELGHCIGFRHTDYMLRAYSCGSGGNEGQAKNGVGAVHIPGTPTKGDPNSWMLACIGSNVNRPFNTNDITALKYVY